MGKRYFYNAPQAGCEERRKMYLTTQEEAALHIAYPALSQQEQQDVDKYDELKKNNLSVGPFLYQILKNILAKR
jgi:hypothetical protein